MTRTRSTPVVRPRHRRRAAKASDVMSPVPRAVTPDAPVGLAARLMRDLGVSAIPVVFDEESRRPIGVITDRDIAVRHAALEHGRSCAVWEHMTAGRVDTVPTDASLGRVRRRLRFARSGRLLVVDDRGGLVGIVTRSDLGRDAVAPARRSPPAREP